MRHIDRLVNEAAEMAYHWAKIEQETLMRPHALKGLNATSAVQRGGATTRDKRRAKAATTWQAHALELAKALRAKHPDYSQDALVVEIPGCWKLQDIEPPGAKTLKRFVSAQEKNGALASRVRSRHAHGTEAA
jgi:hypothetical protein